MKRILPVSFAFLTWLLGDLGGVSAQQAGGGSWRQVGQFNCAANATCGVSCADKNFAKAFSAVLFQADQGRGFVLNVYDSTGRNIGAVFLSGQTCLLEGMGFTPLK
jgi:hypothetical protein